MARKSILRSISCDVISLDGSGFPCIHLRVPKLVQQEENNDKVYEKKFTTRHDTWCRGQQWPVRTHWRDEVSVPPKSLHPVLTADPLIVHFGFTWQVSGLQGLSWRRWSDDWRRREAFRCPRELRGFRLGVWPSCLELPSLCRGLQIEFVWILLTMRVFIPCCCRSLRLACPSEKRAAGKK